MRPRLPAGDGGYSLIELLVVLTISSIIGAVFTTGVLQVYRTANAEDSDFTTQSQISQALLRLEKQVRYAYSIGAVHTETAGTYFEYLVMAGVAGQSTLVKRCVQLRLTTVDASGMQLQSRSWTQGSTGTVTGWTPLAGNLATPGSAPFVRTSPTSAVNHQLLTVRLTARSGTSTRTSSVTFTALNTYAGTALDANGAPLAATAEPCYAGSLRS